MTKRKNIFPSRPGEKPPKTYLEFIDSIEHKWPTIEEYRETYKQTKKSNKDIKLTK